MAQINLLPWREKLRAAQRREFGMMLLLAAIIGVAGMGYWHFFNEDLIDFQKKRNAFLTREIAVVDKQIAEIKALEKTRAKLIARMEVIQNLQTSRPQIVHLFDELIETLPDGTYLNTMNQSGRGLSITGQAQSNTRVSSYMRKIEASTWLDKPKLNVIQGRGQAQGMRNFSLTASQVVPKAEAEE